MSAEPSIEQNRRLVQRLKRRDPNAMMELYDRYGRLIFSIIFRAVNDTGVAEDITQETFLRVWNRIGSFDETKGQFERWLVTVARNRAFDHLRSIRNAPAISSVSLTDLERSGLYAVDPGHADQVVSAEAVRDALNRLSPDQREVIELTHFEGMTQTEIAGKLNKPLGTVKGLVRSALKSLRSAVVSIASAPIEVARNEVAPSRQVRNDL
jgi:RNA polymerase sigma-70 factor (ECF subfamily)